MVTVIQCHLGASPFNHIKPPTSEKHIATIQVRIPALRAFIQTGKNIFLYFSYGCQLVIKVKEIFLNAYYIELFIINLSQAS